MANYNSYNSIGIDFKIKIIQDALFNRLGFSNVDFYGRVQKGLNKDIKTIVPEVHISKSERKEVYYDDINAPGGNVFFVEEDDKHTTKDGIVFTAKIKIVFMLNLEKLYPNSNTRNDSEVQEYIIKLVRKLRVLEVNAVEKGLNSVLKGFSTENIKLNDMQPYHIFSINGTLNYMYSCSTPKYTAPEPTPNPEPEIETIPCLHSSRSYYNALDKFIKVSDNSTVNIKNLTSAEIIEMWKDNVNYKSGIGESGFAKCQSGFAVNDKIFVQGFAMNIVLPAYNGYWLFDPLNEYMTYALIQQNQSISVTSRRAPVRTSDSPVDITAVSPKLIKLVNGIITEVIDLETTGFYSEN